MRARMDAEIEHYQELLEEQRKPAAQSQTETPAEAPSNHSGEFELRYSDEYEQAPPAPVQPSPQRRAPRRIDDDDDFYRPQTWLV